MGCLAAYVWWCRRDAGVLRTLGVVCRLLLMRGSPAALALACVVCAWTLA